MLFGEHIDVGFGAVGSVQGPCSAGPTESASTRQGILTLALNDWNGVLVTTNAVILDLMKRHVLWEDEEVERVRYWPDGLALTTSIGRHMVAGSEPDAWLVSQEEWVDDVVIANRDDLIVYGGGGNPVERHGFLLLADGGDVYVNDAVAVAELGRRLAGDINPMAYAELLVEFHPYSSAVRKVLSRPDELRQLIGHEDVPDIEPPRVRQTPAGLTLIFSSTCQYRWPAEGPLLDLMTWTVQVPAGEPAQWETRIVAQRIRLYPRPGFGDSRRGTNVPFVDRMDTFPRGDSAILRDEAARIAEMWGDGNTSRDDA